MTIARRELIDVSVARWYHCMTRCVRRAFLLGEGLLDRKQWFEDGLEELAHIFAVGVGGFSVMDNHVHLLLRLDPEVAAGWSDEEVARRRQWLIDRAPQVPTAAADFRGMGQRPPQGHPMAGGDSRAVGEHQLVHEMPEGRNPFHGAPTWKTSVEVPSSRPGLRAWRFSTRSASATSTYIDLNPVAAKIAEVPETSEYTSIKQRVEHIKAQDATTQLEAAKSGSVAGSQRQAVWRKCCGFARSRIDASWIHRGRACSRL